MWTIRLKSPAGQHTIRDFNPISLYPKLLARIRSELKLPEATNFSLLYGFPPLPLHASSNAQVSSLLNNNETLIVQIGGTSSAAAPSLSTPSPRQPSSSPNVAPGFASNLRSLSDIKSPPRPPLPYLRNEEELDEDFVGGDTNPVDAANRRKSTRKRKEVRLSGPAHEPPPKKPKLDSISITPEGQLKPPKVKKPRLKFPKGKGQVLGDATAVEVDPTRTETQVEKKSEKKLEKKPEKKGEKVGRKPTLDPTRPPDAAMIEGFLAFSASTEEGGSSLVDRAQSGLTDAMLKAVGEMGTIASEGFDEAVKSDGLKYLKGAFKVGLEVAEEEVKAISRYRSSLEGSAKYEQVIVPDEQGHMQPRLKVTFTNDAGQPVEEVYEEYTPHELARLFAFILSTKGEEGKEHLKPFKMARVSPRSFWNLCRHFGTADNGLRAIFPRLDWSHLKQRRRSESEKAKQMREAEAFWDAMEVDEDDQDEEKEEEEVGFQLEDAPPESDDMEDEDGDDKEYGDDDEEKKGDLRAEKIDEAGQTEKEEKSPLPISALTDGTD